jgi:hypothetical protein
MSVYFFELQRISEKEYKFGMATNVFWQNSSGNSYNTLVNYVIYGDDNKIYSSKGHYAFGQLFIQSNPDSSSQANSPNLIINDQKKGGITNVYTQYNETGTCYLLIDSPIQVPDPVTTTNAKYYMKCTVI